MSSTNGFPQDLRTGLAQLGVPETVEAFNRSGCLQVSDFLPQDKISALADAFTAVYENREKSGDFLNVGNKRNMIPVPVTGEFSDPSVFAPPELSQFLMQVLGVGYVMSCYTCVTSLPGAPSQHQHKDFVLFGGPFDYFSPGFAINLFIPLVDMNAVNGTTRIWPYSHRNPSLSCEGDAEDGIYPSVPTGSAILMDYRITHEGTPNLSLHNRPVLCIAFTRNWFLDVRHFNETNPLVVSDDTLLLMTDEHRALFSMAKLYKNLKHDDQ